MYGLCNRFSSLIVHVRGNIIPHYLPLFNSEDDEYFKSIKQTKIALLKSFGNYMNYSTDPFKQCRDLFNHKKNYKKR